MGPVGSEDLGKEGWRLQGLLLSKEKPNGIRCIPDLIYQESVLGHNFKI